jgi:imidazolonepropionase-like amidohydrolase
VGSATFICYKPAMAICCRAMVVTLALAGCGGAVTSVAVNGDDGRAAGDPTRNPRATTLAIRDATILTATGRRIERGVVVLAGGAIVYVGDDPGAIPAGATVIAGASTWVTPGLIDAHSHLGVQPSLAVDELSERNESTGPFTATARADQAYWPQDPAIGRARAGGVTTALVLPGSNNLIGGQGFVVVVRPGQTIDDVRFPAAPRALKLSCGENVLRRYPRGPQTRMGAYSALRATFRRAAAQRARRDRSPDVELEPLIAALDGDALVHVHCYRADDLDRMLRLAADVGLRIRTFHHALEAYKIRGRLVAAGVSIATWAEMWGGKLEMFDAIPENAALFSQAGGRAIIHSDSTLLAQRLNHEAARAMYAGRAAGLEVSQDQALRWITAEAAWALGIDRWVGTLEPGKRAELVVWSGDPFSIYSAAELVIQAGEVTYRRGDGVPPTDVELEPAGGGR